MAVQLHEAHRQAMRVRVVLLIVLHALRAQVLGPRLIRRAARNVRADVEEGRARGRVRSAGGFAGVSPS